MSAPADRSAPAKRARDQPASARVDEPVEKPADKRPTYQELLDEAVDETFPASDPISPTAAMRADAEVSTPTNERDWALRPGSGEAEARKPPGERTSADSGDNTSGSGAAGDSPPSGDIDRGPIPFPTSDRPPKSRTERVREAAYRRYLARGEAGGGSALQDWLDAEAEVDGDSGSR